MPAKLGILAGGGELPARLVETCRATGREVFVLAFEGQTDPATVVGVDHAWTRLGLMGSALKTLRQAGVTELVLVGAIERPRLSELRVDFRGLQFLAKLRPDSLGDDGLLRAVIGALEEGGFRVLGIDEILEDLIAPAGPYGALVPDEQAERDIARGIVAAKALGAKDEGQAVVVQQDVVLGVETAEGTDALLRRCADLRRAGPGGVLVKIRKPQQETRVDLPTIGPQTVTGAAAAGLGGIAVEAGGTLVVDRPVVARKADAAGLFVIGVEVPA
ncbi:MAG: UDP-2,3-diacylglucosamine diphosphatase LpxI [Alphaproteobacteria bacterium]